MGTLIKLNPAERQYGPALPRGPWCALCARLLGSLDVPWERNIEGQIGALAFKTKRNTKGRNQQRKNKEGKLYKIEREGCKRVKKLGLSNNTRVGLWSCLCGGVAVLYDLRPLDIAISLRSGGRSSFRSVCPRAFASTATLALLTTETIKVLHHIAQEERKKEKKVRNWSSDKCLDCLSLS